MAFISSCPKCQKQVLVPDGTSADAVVQCPICSVEYSMGDLLAAAPPALIVVHPGTAVITPLAAPLGEAIPAPTAALSATVPPELSEVAIFAAHRVEPSLHDAEPLLFAGDAVQLATPDYGHTESLGHEGAEPLAEAALVEPGPTAPPESGQPADHPIEALAAPFGEALAAPLSEEGHDLSAASADGDAPWGGAWGGFKDETAHEEDGAIGLAEPDQDEGLEHVDFAAITGKPAPGSATPAGAGGVAVAAEPPKKKRRRREANPLVRIIGVVFCGLLALPCAYGIAIWVDHKNDRFHFFYKENEPTASNGQKTSGPAKPPANGHTPVVAADPTPASATPPAPDAGKATQSVAKQPDQAVGETKPGPTPNKLVGSDIGKGDADQKTEVAMNEPPKNATKPPAPSTAKSKTEEEEPSPFDENTQPKAKPDDALIAPPPTPSPVNEKAKTDAKTAVPVPVKPEIPGKPEKPAPGTNPLKTSDLKPDTEPVIGPEPKPQPKSEPKPAVKPDAGLGPLQAPSFPVADLAASLKAVSGAATVDAKSYADWCKLAEVVTYVKDGADAQRQALRTLTEKVASSPQAAFGDRCRGERIRPACRAVGRNCGAPASAFCLCLGGRHIAAPEHAAQDHIEHGNKDQIQHG